jgi:hypothetical protein
MIGRRSVFVKLAAFALPAMVALAQPPRGRGGNPEKMLERHMSELKTRLNLTAEQEPKVRAVFEENGKKMAELRKKWAASSEGKRPGPEAREEMRKMRQDTRDALAKVLNEDQMKQYDQFQSERDSRMRDRAREHRQKQEQKQDQQQ